MNRKIDFDVYCEAKYTVTMEVPEHVLQDPEALNDYVSSHWGNWEMDPKIRFEEDHYADLNEFDAGEVYY